MKEKGCLKFLNNLMPPHVASSDLYVSQVNGPNATAHGPCRRYLTESLNHVGPMSLRGY